MAFAAQLNTMEAALERAAAAPVQVRHGSVDWAREHPEQQYERLAAGWRVIAVSAAAASAWAVIGTAGFAVARASGIA